MNDTIKDIANIISNNPDIHNNLKNDMIYCCSILLEKYPYAYRTLAINLSSLKTIKTNEMKNEKYIELYDFPKNTLIYNEDFSFKNFIYTLMHSILHIASNRIDEIGLKSASNLGSSINEGMTEYLTHQLLGYSKDNIVYEDEINYINLLESIIGEDNMEQSYFSKGLLDLATCYSNVVGTNNNLNIILEGMDGAYEADNEQIKIFLINNILKNYLDDTKKIDFENSENFIQVFNKILSIVSKYSKILSDELLNEIKETAIKQASKYSGINK